MTVDEFYALPPEELEGNPELIDGELVYRSHARMRHGSSQGRFVRVLADLDPYDPDAPGWWIVVEQDWRLNTRNILVPDVAGWRRERLPEVVEGPIEIRPDWVCELVSPGHESHDLKFKSRVYREHEVPWYWTVFPESGLVQVFQNAGPTWTLHGTYAVGEKARIPPFEELEIVLDHLFLPPLKNR